jgi:hypothetical protein
MRDTVCQEGCDNKVCHYIDLGLLQEVIPLSLIEELLDTYQMREEREQQLNMLVMMYWLIVLHLYPKLLK